MSEIRHYLTLLQASEGYPLRGTTLTTEEETPVGPHIYLAVRTLDIEEYLDDAITKWRELREDGDERDRRDAPCYIDAFQSVRSSLLGERLPCGERLPLPPKPESLQAECDRYREALSFYADRVNYAPVNPPGTGAPIWNDVGKRAREALESR